MRKLFKLPENRQFNYIPRYYDPEKEKKKRRIGEDIRMERGSFYRYQNSPLVGAFSGRKERAFNRNTSRRGQFMRTALLFLMLGLLAMYLLEMLSAIFAFCFIAILMIFFISKINAV